MSRRRSPREADLFAELPPISYVWRTATRRALPAEWDIPDGARSGRLTPAMRAKLERIVKRVPEVMVKITGRTKSVEHLKSHFEYITEPPRVCRRPQLLRGWGHGSEEEDVQQIFT